MVENPVREIAAIYSFIGFPFGARERKLVRKHNNVVAGNVKVKKPRYYNTYRGNKFDPHHWKSEIDSEQLKTIEDNCIGVMRKLNYSIEI